jgi:hypothetical protein
MIWIPVGVFGMAMASPRAADAGGDAMFARKRIQHLFGRQP